MSGEEGIGIPCFYNVTVRSDEFYLVFYQLYLTYFAPRKWRALRAANSESNKVTRVVTIGSLG